MSADQGELNECNPETIELSIVCGGSLKKIAKWVNIKVISAQLQLQKYPDCLFRIFYPAKFVVRKKSLLQSREYFKSRSKATFNSSQYFELI